ncbi:MAG: fumarate hydratase, partial [Bacteroidales bacterium]|nr:fumarate hydratase [Bacteroidales bacterium]
MPGFVYEKMFQTGKDETAYRLLTKDFVKVEESGERQILKINPEGLVLLAREAVNDLSFFLRSSHLAKLRMILEDPEASDNDRFVAWVMLKNSVISAKGDLPWCQDTGTATVIGYKGEDVYTGADDAMFLSKGIYETFRDKNLRYSQIVPLTMFDEKNSCSNLPAQIDIYASPGGSYEFLFITKGGGSANKMLLYHQSKSLLNEEGLTNFVKEKIKDLGTSACPPYHLVLVVG